MKRKVIFILITVIVLSLAFPISASAASGITEIDEFKGNIKNADNYYLDRVSGLFDKWEDSTANTVANFIFGIFKEFSYVACVFFYHCFAFNIVDIFGDQLTAIQSALRKVFFDGALFLIVFATSAFYIIKQLLKGNLQNLLSEVLKVIAIFAISFAVATESVSFLTFVNTMTKSVAVDALGGISGQTLSSSSDQTRESNLKTYAADAAGILWFGLVHTPWMSLEFGEGYGNAESDASRILSLAKTSKAREELIKDLNGSDISEGPFNEKVGWDRIFPAFSMTLPIIIKCIFYLIIALLQIGFQIITLFYVILCPIILLLAISPQLGGVDLIWSWLKKIAETQISILILTFIIGLVVRFDSLLANWNNVGWLIGLWLQVIAMIMLVLNWQKVLKVMSRTTRSIQNPGLAMRDLKYSGNMYESSVLTRGIPAVAHGAQQLGGTAVDAVANGASSAWNSLAENYKANYNSIPQYQPSEKAKVIPRKLNTTALKDTNGSTSTNQASGIDNLNGKVVDFSKIPRYKSDRAAEPMQRPVSYQVAVNGDNLYSANKTDSDAAQKPYTVNYGTRASNYFAADKTPSEVTQRPRTASYAQGSSKSADPPAAHTDSPKMPSGSSARQVTPKPITESFKFDPQRSISRTNPVTPRSENKSQMRPKPVVEQFNFKVHGK